MPSCQIAEFSVLRHSVKVRLHYYEEREDAFEGTAQDVYALAAYYDSASDCDEYLDVYDR